MVKKECFIIISQVNNYEAFFFLFIFTGNHVDDNNNWIEKESGDGQPIDISNDTDP